MGATLARFYMTIQIYMTIQTSLSDAALARRGIPCLQPVGGLETRNPPQTPITEGRGFIPSVNGLGNGPLPLAQTYPRKPLPPGVQRWRFLIANGLRFFISFCVAIRTKRRGDKGRPLAQF
jgi:hypothetical protein